MVSARHRTAEPRNRGEQAIDLVSSEGEAEVVEKRPGKRQKQTQAAGPCLDIYSKGCKCRKGNPFCLAGIIPAPGGFRKKGLWQKDSKALLTQGLDPSHQLREVSTSGLASASGHSRAYQRASLSAAASALTD